MKCHSMPYLENHYASTLFRWKPRDLTKIAIQRDKCSSFGGANLEERFVGTAVQTLIPHRQHVMANRSEKLQSATSDVFIQFKLHATRPIGTGITRSRVSSAP